MRSRVFNGAIALHVPGLEGLDKPIVSVFPKLNVCLECSEVRFKLPESEMSVLRDGLESKLPSINRLRERRLSAKPLSAVLSFRKQ